MRASWTITVAIALVSSTACAGNEQAVGAGQTDDTVRVPATLLFDIDVTLPENVGGVDLGDVAPESDLSFCEAFATVPIEWINGAVLPLQFWVDAWADVNDEPNDVNASLGALREFGDLRIAWNFKRVDERPEYDENMARHAVAVADAAVETCGDLPLVVGLDPVGSAPSWWADESDESIDGMCDEFAAEVAQAISEYFDRNARSPGHVEQLNADAFVAWAFGDGELFVTNGYFGVTQGPDGAAAAAAVSGGACDR